MKTDDLAPVTYRRRGRTLLGLALLALAIAVPAYRPAMGQVGPPSGDDNPGEDVSEEHVGGTVVGTLRDSLATLEAIAARPDPLVPTTMLLPAVQKVRMAQARFLKPNARIPDVLNRLAGVAKQIDKTIARSADAGLHAELRAVEADLLDVARTYASERLTRAGLAPGFDPARLAKGTALFDAAQRFEGTSQPAGAIAAYGKALKSLDYGFEFDVDLFEQNIRAAFDGVTVGYSYAINRKGKLARADGIGLARTAMDGQTNQSEFKRMNIASLTKTMTAVAVLKLLDERDVALDSSIATWLPADWTLGPGIEELTFRQLLTHVSGLGGRDGNNNLADCGTSFNSLRACVAAGVVEADQVAYNYNNGNFGLFRIMIPYLSLWASPIGQHCNTHPDCPTATDESTATTYRYYMQCAIFEPMGLSGPANPFDNDPYDCPGPDLFPTDPNPTLFYGLPGENINGVADGDWRFVAGGGGWYFSAFEVARFLAHLRYNNAILPSKVRTQMYSEFLGWNDPIAWAARVDGVWGQYRSHGGFLQYGPAFNGRANTQYHASCIMDFPGEIQAVVLVNGLTPNPERCVRLKNAYEAAWVAK